MGKGSSTPASSGQLAAPLVPFHEQNLLQAQTLAFSPEFEYQPYQGERLAGLSENQAAAYQSLQDIFERGDPYGDYAATQMYEAGRVPGTFQDIDSQYVAKDFGESRFHPLVMGEFDSTMRRRYMNPYQQAVTDQAIGAATQEFQRQQMKDTAKRVASGAMGGYREALGQMFAGSEQAKKIGELQASGSREAFLNAQEQFQRDRMAAVEAAKLGDASALEAERMRTAQLRANEERRFTEANMRQAIAGRMADLGTRGQREALERVSALEQAGAKEQQLRQAGLTMAEEDFYRQQFDPFRRMEWLTAQTVANPGASAFATPGQHVSPIAALLASGLGSIQLQNLLG
jgi:hypothetical protein